jgi:hypothetical protein
MAAYLRFYASALGQCHPERKVLSGVTVATAAVCALPSSVERTGIEPVTSGLQSGLGGRTACYRCGP